MSDTYDLRPTEADLDDESLAEFDIDKHRCEVIGAHRWITVCSSCGKQQGPHHLAEYLEWE